MHRWPTLTLGLSLCLAGGCGSYDRTGPTEPPPSPEANDVTIVKGASGLTTTAFAPNPKTLSLGGGAEVSVRWVNTDGGSGYGGTPVPHQLASDDGAFAMSQVLGSGATYLARFTKEGTYRYHCAIHPNMIGTIRVTP